MSSELVTCPMCGHRFDPRGHEACQACPLQRGCQLICCPACNYEMVDVSQSALANWAFRLLSSKRRNSSRRITQTDKEHRNDISF